MSHQIRFAVIGDTHYVHPDSHAESLKNNTYGDADDIYRYIQVNRDVLPRILDTIAHLKPDFIVHTGDVVQGNCDHVEAALLEMEEALKLFESIGVPVFYAVGNHDGVPHQESVSGVLYSVIGKALGKPVDRGYYSFIRGNSLFVVLDFTSFHKGGDQATFIKKVLGESAAYDHVFIFAHPPLVPVARPFFSNYDFAETVLEAAARNRVDAYFCGHTHNQVTSLHKVGDYWLPQMKSSPIGDPDERPVPITEVRPLLPNPVNAQFCWGFLEDTAPGWWIVTVDGDRVAADWHVLHHGVVGQMAWRKGEKPQVVRQPSFVFRQPEGLPQSNRIKSVRLRAAGVSCRAENAYRVYLNDSFVGYLPRLEAFSCRKFLSLDPSMWSSLRDRNLLRVTTAVESMCIGGFVLEIETDEGWICSSVSPFFTNTNRWDQWDMPCLRHISGKEDIELELVFLEDANVKIKQSKLRIEEM
jgi:Icc-related predicted phosphoesterase